MTSLPVSPLCQRMIEDISLRQFGPKTQHDYVRVVADFARFLGRSPDQAEPEDLRRYQLHLASQGASPAKMNAAVSALRFFFKVTLGRSGFGERLATVRKEERLPVVLSPEEVALLLHCAPSLKHTHLLERRTDVRVIQVLLGHKKLDTTARYTRVALKTLGAVKSPVDHLKPPPPPPPA
jgi:integrase/recombinase XerD